MLMNEVNWDKAKGSKVLIDKKWYIDFTSSIFTQNFGHNNSYVIKEVKKQLKNCSHAYGYNTEIKEKYVEKLKQMLGYKNILLFSTGAEAIEATIKIAINNGYDCVGVKGSMHGRTLGAEALVGKRKLPNIETWDSAWKNPVVYKKAIFIEGYRGYDCKQLNVNEMECITVHQDCKNLIIFDEIQSGFFRTQSMFMKNHYHIQPDILVIGKSMGGGFPLSAVCWDKDLSLDGIELTSTHSGQPLQMAAGYGVLNYIEHGLYNSDWQNNIDVMDRFWNFLELEHNNIGMVGAFKTNSENLLYEIFYSEGLLVTKTGKGWIKVAPPINTDRETLIKGLDIIRKYINVN